MDIVFQDKLFLFLVHISIERKICLLHFVHVFCSEMNVKLCNTEPSLIEHVSSVPTETNGIINSENIYAEHQNGAEL